MHILRLHKGPLTRYEAKSLSSKTPSDISSKLKSQFTLHPSLISELKRIQSNKTPTVIFKPSDTEKLLSHLNLSRSEIEEDIIKHSKKHNGWTSTVKQFYWKMIVSNNSLEIFSEDNNFRAISTRLFRFFLLGSVLNNPQCLLKNGEHPYCASIINYGLNPTAYEGPHQDSFHSSVIMSFPSTNTDQTDFWFSIKTSDKVIYYHILTRNHTEWVRFPQKTPDTVPFQKLGISKKTIKQIMIFKEENSEPCYIPCNTPQFEMALALISPNSSGKILHNRTPSVTNWGSNLNHRITVNISRELDDRQGPRK